MLFSTARLVRVIVFPGLILSLLVAISLLLATGILTRGPQSLAFSVSNGDGTGTGTGTTLGTPVPLAQSFSTELKGDYVAAGVGMRGTGPPGGGTIALPAPPGGSTVQKAFLYWAVMNDTTIPSLANGNINGNAITGSLIGKTANPCWSGEIHNYVADVTSFALPGANNVLTGFASGGLPINTQPILEGASLVLIYSNPASSNRTIIIHEGAVSFILPPPESTTFGGFSAAAGTSSTTYIVADGQQPGGLGLNNRTLVDGVETANHTLNGAGPGTQYWDTLTQNISAFIPPSDTSVMIQVESAADFGVADCITWVAQVLAVPAVEPTPTPTPTPSPTATPTPGIGVGGIVQINTGSDAPVEQSLPADSPASPIAAAVGGAMIAVAAGGWYASRRWPR